MENKKIEVKGLEISLFQKNKDDYICITDMAKYKNQKETALVIAHWLRTGNTIEFLGIWEQIYNPLFNTTEFGSIKGQCISNSFILTTIQWVSRTNAIGIFSNVK